MNHEMKGELLLAEFLATPWALMPERLNALTAVLGRWSRSQPAGDDVLAQVMADREARQAARHAVGLDEDEGLFGCHGEILLNRQGGHKFGKSK